MMIRGSYQSYRVLQSGEQEGVDYEIQLREGRTGLAVVAPHAGGIEPGTLDIARELAGSDHAFYAFKGLKPRGNAVLHITSSRFDEPRGSRLVAAAERVVVVHGCRSKQARVLVGGRDTLQVKRIIAALRSAGFEARTSDRPGLRGLHPENLCNRGRSGQGVQLEVSHGLRRQMFRSLHYRPDRRTTPLFTRFIEALRQALA